MCEIDKLEIDWEDNSAINIDFFVQFSMDNEIWSDPVTGQKIGLVSVHIISVLEDTITARYVKVTGKVTLGYNAVSICELEIWGVSTDIPLTPEPEQSLNLDAANLARGKTATAYKNPIV